MDAFDKADAMVQLWGGLLGVAVMAFFAYRMFAGHKRVSPTTRKPGSAEPEVQGAAAHGNAPASLDDAGSPAPSLSDPQKKTVSGFAKWWLILGMVANIGAALAPAAALTNSPAPGLVFLVMLLAAATAFGCYLLLRRNHFGLYVILIANTLAAFMNQIQIPGLTILVKTGLIPAILTYFVTRKQVPYPFGSGGRGSGQALRETVEPASPEPAQIVDSARQSTLLESGQPGEPNAALSPSPAAPSSRREAAAPAVARPRVTLPLAIGLVAIIATCVISIALLVSARPGDKVAGTLAGIASSGRSRPAVIATLAWEATASPQPPRVVPTSDHAATATAQARGVTPTTRASATASPTRALPTPIPTRAPATLTATRQATRSPQPQPATATTLPAAGIPAAAGRMPLVFRDTFDSNTHGWPTGAEKGAAGTVTRDFGGGKYLVVLNASQAAHLSSGAPETGALTDFYASIDVQQISSPADGAYGLEFRAQGSDSRYFFGVLPPQQFALVVQQNGQWTVLIPPTVSTALQPAGANRLAVLAEGSHFRLFINDRLVGELDDARLASGAVLLAIEAPQTGGNVVFEFDNFELRAPAAVLTLPAFGGNMTSTATATARPAATPSAAVTREPVASPTTAPTRTSVPRDTPTLSPTRGVSAPPTTVAACPNPAATIRFPPNGAPISGIVPFIGSASVENLAYYKIEYRPAGATTWNYLTQVDGQKVQNDKLMDFHSTTVAPGVYDFRLIVVDRSGNYPPPCEITVTVRR